MQKFLKYRVMYNDQGCNFEYGYAPSIGEAIEVRSHCQDEGWYDNWTEAWDEITGQWVRIN